jgi:hypothetical protein
MIENKWHTPTLDDLPPDGETVEVRDLHTQEVKRAYFWWDFANEEGEYIQWWDVDAKAWIKVSGWRPIINHEQ